ncbi:MAG: phospho-N-acetylmuramoyl-pentapeptide-transferase [Clostridia bacterium]|nr:phospho-N-acetylmuramoyl-pentapeptide-transferase [Clostridia bacterium]
MWTSEITCLLIAFALAAALGPAVIPLMRKLKFGQIERDNGVDTHLKKQGTPTMGGWIFLIPVVAVAAVMAVINKNPHYLVLPGVALLFGAVGFVDDFLKIKKRSKDGLLWYQKMLLLLAVSAGFACYMQFAGTGSSISFMLWGHNYTFSMGWFYIPFVVFVLVAESNAVNLTDGLDGLCGGTSAMVFLFFALVSTFLVVSKEAGVFASTFVGALAGFLVYNYYPAKIFMGDTGSLALGGALGAVAVMIGHPFMIFFAGLLFVLEALSVLLQVGYFKLTHGKRIFKMAPLHHHFEKSGWKELKVTYVFWGFTLIMCVLTYIVARGFSV